MAAPILELSFRRASVHLVHDVKCLEESADLNDALLDFFVKLGQALVPEDGLDAARPPVAYLGSHFYDVLCKGGAADGRVGHANVANWASRRLGPGGLFSPEVGALAVPVNETLRDEKGGDMGKHWWLALVLNLGAPGEPPANGGRRNSLVCLDSYARAEIVYDPPCRAALRGTALSAYPVEVQSLARAGCHALLRFRAKADGSAGPLLDPQRSVLRVDGRDFEEPEVELLNEESGQDGQHSLHDGYMHFELDSAACTTADHVLEYGGIGAYTPPLRLRLRTGTCEFQTKVAHFLGGYLHKEWAASSARGQSSPSTSAAVVPEEPQSGEASGSGEILLPDVPQQETSNDCGYFMLEQILRTLRLSAEALRRLAAASVEDLSALPWPSQAEVLERKDQLREGLGALFEAAQRRRQTDVEVLLREDPILREQVRLALVGPPLFEAAVAALLEAQAQPGLANGSASDSQASQVGQRSPASAGPGEPEAGTPAAGKRRRST